MYSDEHLKTMGLYQYFLSDVFSMLSPAILAIEHLEGGWRGEDRI